MRDARGALKRLRALGVIEAQKLQTLAVFLFPVPAAFLGAVVLRHQVVGRGPQFANVQIFSKIAAKITFVALVIPRIKVHSDAAVVLFHNVDALNKGRTRRH